jgi:Spy/CpxP family protein refolding chaperone
MKQIFAILLFFVTSFTVFSQKNQNNRGNQGGEKIKAMKIGMITEELNLNTDQAEKFWPVYNDYSDERQAIMKEIRQKSRKSNDQNDSNDDILKNQDEILELKQKEITLTKKYRDSFLKVISVAQYSKLMDAERKFNEMLLEKLKERREKNKD